MAPDPDCDLDLDVPGELPTAKGTITARETVSGGSVILLGKFFGWTFAVALFVAAGWYALIAKRVTVADPPMFAEGEPFDRMLRRFVDWQVTTFAQERLDIAIAIVAFVALIGLGRLARRRGWVVAVDRWKRDRAREPPGP